MTTAIFIITSNNRATKLLNRKYIVLPCNGIDSIADISQLTQGVFKVRRPCQSTIMGAASAGLHHSDRALRTARFEKGDFKIGIKKKHWVDFYQYRMDVYTLFQQTFMFKQLEK